MLVYCSLRTFFKSCFGLYHHLSCKFLLGNYWTEDAPLTPNRFLSKTLCNQIQLCHFCGVLILKCGDVHEPEPKQSYESSRWQTNSSKAEQSNMEVVTFAKFYYVADFHS